MKNFRIQKFRIFWFQREKLRETKWGFVFAESEKGEGCVFYVTLKAQFIPPRLQIVGAICSIEESWNLMVYFTST